MTVSEPGTTSQVVGLCVSAASSFRRGEATGLRVLALPVPLAVDEGAVDFGAAVGIFEGGGGAGGEPLDRAALYELQVGGDGR